MGTQKKIQKKRLDDLLVLRELAQNKDQAARLIAGGKVKVAGHCVDKTGALIAFDAEIQVQATRPFVSRGGEKLQAALAALQLNPTGWICLDVGSSTGGFTDCLLQHGASKVFCIDVGYGILDWKLRSDTRVTVLERTNARYLSKEQIPEAVDLAVIDASFISLEPLLPPLLPLFRSHIRILALIKPQFQLPRSEVASGGVVTDTQLHEKAISMVQGFAEGLGLSCAGLIPSPVKGAKGNQEFFTLLEGANSTCTASL